MEKIDELLAHLHRDAPLLSEHIELLTRFRAARKRFSRSHKKLKTDEYRHFDGKYSSWDSAFDVFRVKVKNADVQQRCRLECWTYCDECGCRQCCDCVCIRSRWLTLSGRQRTLQRWRILGVERWCINERKVLAESSQCLDAYHQQIGGSARHLAKLSRTIQAAEKNGDTEKLATVQQERKSLIESLNPGEINRQIDVTCPFSKDWVRENK